VDYNRRNRLRLPDEQTLSFLRRCSMLESEYQAGLIKRIKALLPGCHILKNDANYRQGVPDLLILFGARWAALEVKASATARKRPNQDYYVNLWNEQSFAAFIFPDNEKAVLHGLQLSLRAAGPSCTPSPQ
jgi:hypothetical protein